MGIVRLPRPAIFAVLVAFTLIAPLAIHMFIPALPVVKDEFDISTGLAQATISLVFAVMSVATIIYGGLSDRHGRKPVMLGGLLLYVLGGVMCWFSTGIGILLAGRFLQAMGTGCGVVLARAVVRDLYGMERVAQAIAYLTAAYVLGPLLAPPLGGVMIDALGWRSIFLLSTGLGLLLIVVVAFLVPETHQPGRHSAAGAGILASYARLLRDVRFTAFAVQPGLNSGAFFSLATGGSFLATEALGASASDYGFWFVLLAAGFMVGNFIAGQVGNRRSVKFMTRLSSIWTFGVVVGMLAALLIQPLSMRLIFIPGMLLGIGQGLGLSYAQTGAMAIDPRLAGSASGAVTFFQFLFAALGQQIVGVLANGTWVPLVSTMLVFTGFALTAAIVASRPATTQAF